MILNIHALTSQSRMTNIQHSLFLSRHINENRIESVNLLLIDTKELTRKEYDLGVVNYEVLAYRSSPLWPIISQKLSSLLAVCRRKILIVQDDYTHNSKIKSFISDQGIDFVYSSVKHDLNILYSGINRKKTQILHLPTGLFEPNDMEIYEKLRRPIEQRISGAYSSYRQLPRYFGTMARRKSDLVQQIEKYVQENDNISLKIESGKNLFGENWLSKLAQYKFSLHHKGGASLIDRFGELRLLERVLPENSTLKNLVFNRIENRNRRSRVGNFSASGPRLIESILMKCVLLAPKDEYELNLVLGRDYVEVFPDNPKLSILNISNFTNEELEKISDNALQKLLQDSLMNYCERAKEIIFLGELDLEISHDQLNNHPPDSVTQLLVEMSNIQRQSLDQETALKLSNKFLVRIEKSTHLSLLDRIFLHKLDNRNIDLNESSSSFIYLNLNNGVPLDI